MKRIRQCPETYLSCRVRSGVRVGHDRLGVVVGEAVIEAGLDDPVDNLRRGPCRSDPHALFPEAEVAQDTLDNGALVNQRNDPHLFMAFRAQEQVGFTHLLDELAPLMRRGLCSETSMICTV